MLWAACVLQTCDNIARSIRCMKRNDLDGHSWISKTASTDLFIAVKLSCSSSSLDKRR